MLRFHLPPNFAAALTRDAVSLRLEWDHAASPTPGLLPVLALLQRWCGTATPPNFIQLTRSQLRDLGAAAGVEPIFIERGKSGPWRHTALLDAPQPSLAAVAAPQAASTLPSIARGDNGAPPVVDGSEHFLALALPSREHPRYPDLLALLKENGFILEPSNRKWWLRDRHKTLTFLAAHLSRLREEFGAQFTANFEKNTAHLRTAEVSASIASAGDDFSVTLALRAGPADEAAVRSAVAANRGYLEAGGKIFLLDSARLEKLAAAQRALAGDPRAGLAPRSTQRISAARAAEVQDVIEQLSPDFQPPETWKTRSAALRHLATLTPAPLAPPLDSILRPYQRLGAAWLWHLHRHDIGGILADEMGLGKTLQALGLLSAVCSSVENSASRASNRLPTAPAPALDSHPSTLDLPGASLVVAPASLLENWRREAARFAPQLRVFVHHADRRLLAAADAAAYDLIVTSYGTLASDHALFSAVTFGCIVADEAQHIKNRHSRNAVTLRALRARARFLLTGTPVENSLDDLRSLFEFILPGYLTKLPTGLRGDERAWFDQRLRAQTAPYILRRTKQTVAPELPVKLEHTIWCELGPGQARLYRETQETSERELFDLEAGGASEAKLKFAALTQLLRLRQICCDPRLVLRNSNVSASTDAQPSAPISQLSTLNSQLPPPDSPLSPSAFRLSPSSSSSAKLDALNELLAEAIDDGHRVLVFSQFTSLLALLRAELDSQQLAHCYLDGSMPARARQAEVDRFQRSSDIPLFLLSLKAGGAGLNLTGADTVVHYDPWWNPAAEAQATDRAHRIGQARVVTSYKLIASGTVEEKVLALQAEKHALLAGVFEASDAAAAKLSLADLRSLLR